MDINKILRKAYLEGVSWRQENPAEFDDNADNWVIARAHADYLRYQQLYGENYDDNLHLAELAKWGAYYRRHETSFLLQ